MGIVVGKAGGGRGRGREGEGGKSTIWGLLSAWWVVGWRDILEEW